MPTTRTAAAIRRDLDAAQRDLADLRAQCSERIQDERAAMKAVKDKHDALKAKKLAAGVRVRDLEAELAALGAPASPPTDSSAADPAGATATAPAGDPSPPSDDDADPGDEHDPATDLNAAAEDAAAEPAPGRSTKKKRTRRPKAGG